MYRLGSFVPFVTGLIFIYLSYQLSLGSLKEPGPGLWPIILSLFIAVVSIVLLITERKLTWLVQFTKNSLFPLYGIISLFLYILLFKWIGFILPSLLLLTFWLKFLGKESWRVTIVTTVLITGIFYFLFVVCLKIPFPEDLLLPN